MSIGTPYWLRAVWRDEGEAFARQRARVAEDATRGVDAPDREASLTPVPRRPRFRRLEGSGADCGDCEACIAACPSHALARDVATDDLLPAPLRLDLGRCIGCGLCVEACPEGALELVDAPSALWVPDSGQSPTLVLAERADR